MRRRQAGTESLRVLEPPELAEDRDPYRDKLAGELEIDVSDLTAAAAAQPDLLHRASRALARALVAEDARRRELRAARARVDGMLRRGAREQGREVTDVAIAVQVGDHAEVVRAARAVDNARQEALACRYLYRAFRERGRMLVALAQLAGGSRGRA